LRSSTLAEVSEHDKGLSNIAFNSLLLDSDHVESDSLGNGSALTDSHNVSSSGSSESWAHVSWEVVMSLLESVVLLNVVQVVSSQDNGSVHLSGKNDTPIRSYKTKNLTYLKILPLMEMLEVNGHFLSTYSPSMAACGVLKPTDY